MKKRLKHIIATTLLCGFFFTNTSAETSPIESEIVQIGGNAKGMVEHSVYSDYDTMYRLAAALGRPIRKLPKEWEGYHIIAVMLSLRPDDNPPVILCPDREPDRIETGAEREFYLWDVPAKPYVHAIGPIHVYYAKDMDDFFVVSITPRDWALDPVEEPNGMHLVGLSDFDAYEAVDQKNPVRDGEGGARRYLAYKVLTDDESLSEQDLKGFLLSLPWH